MYKSYIHVTCALNYDFTSSIFWKQKLICKNHMENSGKRTKRKKIQQGNDSNEKLNEKNNEGKLLYFIEININY